MLPFGLFTCEQALGGVVVGGCGQASQPTEVPVCQAGPLHSGEASDQDLKGTFWGTLIWTLLPIFVA